MGDFALERNQPQLMHDLEYGLLCFIQDALKNGIIIRTSTLQEMCSDLYLGLRGLALHDDYGRRLGLGEVTEDHVRTLIGYVTSVCPWCTLLLEPGSPGLYGNIHFCSAEEPDDPDDSIPGSTSGRLPPEFYPSDLWLRALLIRHGIFVCVCGEDAPLTRAITGPIKHMLFLRERGLYKSWK